ncbi:unnamed protein product [Peronospora belbahrii]|uniref:Uncharacterized protein n=1 Tax=Peronospora belbahrii TaxID=622444 RepID=A0AAU9L2R7_9STRA|nr:unnamed protein product [Peronospora belbahrii]
MMHRTEQIVPLSQWRSLWKCSVVNAFHPRTILLAHTRGKCSWHRVFALCSVPTTRRNCSGVTTMTAKSRTLTHCAVLHSATDNPMVFTGSAEPKDDHDIDQAKQAIKRLKALLEHKNKLTEHPAAGMKRTSDTFYRGRDGFVISGGLNSGFMIAHCTAAALVSENKVLTHPSSVDSISTSGSKEDHVSMRKALTVVEHVETVVAIEILAACHALDLLRPLRTTDALEVIHALVRTRVPKFDKDRVMKPDIDAVLDLVRSGAICEVAAPFLTKLHVTEL